MGRVSGILPHCRVALSSTYTLQNAGAHYLTIFIARVIVFFVHPHDKYVNGESNGTDQVDEQAGITQHRWQLSRR